MEPRTRHLIAIDVRGDFESNFKIINEIEKQNKCELRYIVSTRGSRQLNSKQNNLENLSSEIIELDEDENLINKIKWKESRPNLQIITSGQQSTNTKLQTSQHLRDLQTLEIGDICICCLETPGHTIDSASFVITHVTPDSTKIPFLFSGSSLEIGGCGKILQDQGGSAEQMFYSLQKLINLPNETLIFQANEDTISNLKFAKYVEQENPMIDHKLKMSLKVRENGEFTVPSKLMEERLFNPFIRCAREEYFSQITGENDPVRIFTKLRKLRDQFDK